MTLAVVWFGGYDEAEPGVNEPDARWHLSSAQIWDDFQVMRIINDDGSLCSTLLRINLNKSIACFFQDSSAVCGIINNTDRLARCREFLSPHIAPFPAGRLAVAGRYRLPRDWPAGRINLQPAEPRRRLHFAADPSVVPRHLHRPADGGTWPSITESLFTQGREPEPTAGQDLTGRELHWNGREPS